MTAAFRKIISFDHLSMRWIETRRTPLVTLLLKGVTYSGMGLSWLGIAFILNALERMKLQVLPEQKALLRSMICALIAWGAGSLIKGVVKRERPSEVLDRYQVAVTTPSCRSFPSSHAAAACGFLCALLILGHPLAPLVGVWAVLVMISRFYLGVHFPSDVFGGTVLGFVCGLCVLPIGEMV